MGKNVEYNNAKQTVTLDVDEYCTLLKSLKSTNDKINNLINILDSNHENLELDIDGSSKRVITNEEAIIRSEIENMRKIDVLTQKQYIVLKYILCNQYNSDSQVSKITRVSYSSISQWKKKDSNFKEMYNKILLLKTI